MNISTYGAGVKDQPMESEQIPTAIAGILFRVKLSATIETIGGPDGFTEAIQRWGDARGDGGGIDAGLRTVGV